MQPVHCIRCCQVFTTKEKLNTHHLATERCQIVPRKRIMDGITEQQKTQLQSRKAKKNVKTEEDKWINVYFILFPDDDEAPSPCK